MRRLMFVVLATMVALPLATATALETASADAPNAVETSLRISGASASRVKGQLVLSATLTGPDGKPVNNRPVDFYQQVELLGTRDSYLGTALTDATGTASLAYQPAQKGQQTIKARSTLDESSPAVEAVSTIQVGQVVPPIPSEPLPLAPAGQWLVYAVSAVVLGVWAVLLAILATTVLGVRAETSKPGTGTQALASAWARGLPRMGGGAE